MKTILAILALTLLALTAGSVSAQIPTTPSQPSSTSGDEENTTRLWQAHFANGGHYLVKLDRISSASKHEYIGNGTARVVEVTIGTDTAVVARFYFFEPVGKDTPLAAGNIIINRGEQIAKEAANRISPTAGKLNVIKDYPNTTHSHTVEYVVQNEATLTSLYGSLTHAIHTGRGRTWRETSGK